MAWQKKVVWSEGLFLRPQHFQQQERYFEFYSHARSLAQEGFFWGFRKLSIDSAALAAGKVAVVSASGIFQDGTPFHLDEQDNWLAPIDIPQGVKEQRVMLALPVKRRGADEVTFEDTPGQARYVVQDVEVHDTNSIRSSPSPMQLGQLQLRLVLESDLTDGWHALGVARIVERRADNQLVFDARYIAPSLVCNADSNLTTFIRDLHGLIHQRGEACAARLTQPGRGGVAEVADFLMLQLLNRCEPALKHFSDIGIVHPERLYGFMVQLAGELSTFTKTGKRTPAYPRYDHDDPQAGFEPVMDDLRTSLSAVMEQNAMQIALHDRKYGVRVAVMPGAEIVDAADFILAVHADIPPETVRSQFPTQVKIGPVEKIRDLVNLHLPGVAVQPLPIAPRQIPYNAGYNYFRLGTEHELWKQLKTSGGLAIHVAGEFPGLQLEFWAIRR